MKKPIIAVWISLPVLFGASAGVSGESWICHTVNLSRQTLIVYPEAPKTLRCSVFYTKPDENVVPRKLWEQVIRKAIVRTRPSNSSEN